MKRGRSKKSVQELSGSPLVIPRFFIKILDTALLWEESVTLKTLIVTDYILKTWSKHHTVPLWLQTCLQDAKIRLEKWWERQHLELFVCLNGYWRFFEICFDLSGEWVTSGYHTGYRIRLPYGRQDLNQTIQSDTKHVRSLDSFLEVYIPLSSIAPQVPASWSSSLSFLASSTT